MKQEDKQYEKSLAEVKSRQPILDNPEELTASILDRISGISPPKKQRKFLIGAWASGIAATLLLLLFINDTCFTPVSQRTGKQNEQHSITCQLGRNATSGKEHLSILSVYATPEVPKSANLTSH